jgi:hypothetical protein
MAAQKELGQWDHSYQKGTLIRMIHNVPLKKKMLRINNKEQIIAS